MKARWARALPTLIAAIALAAFSGYPLAPSIVAITAALSGFVATRAPFDPATQRLSVVVIATLVIAGVRAADLPLYGREMAPFAFGVGLASLAVSAARLFVARPEGGRRVEIALALLGLFACGSAKAGVAYGAAVAVFLAAVVVSSRGEDAGRAPLSVLPRRGVLGGVAVIGIAAIATGGMAATLVPLSQLLAQRFQIAMIERWEATTGFSDTIRFGRITNLLRNDTVVLRLRGPRVERLRGVLLDNYEHMRWSRAAVEPMEQVHVPSARPTGSDVVELRVVRVDGERLFLPLEARELASPSGAVKRDSMGESRHLPGERAPVVWFRQGPRDVLAVAPPRAADLQIPKSLQAPLKQLAQEWTAGTTGRAAALRAIERRLQRDFTYSKNYSQRTQLDAVQEFLFVTKLGHCEAFASAMVLLARSIDIPARIAAGYVVGAQNPFFGHWVVRQNNAHAWVEAYVAGDRWETFDPTPMSELPQDLPHDEGGFAGVWEALAVGSRGVEDWLSERSIFELGAAALAGLALFAGLRLRRQRALSKKPHDDALVFTRPVPAYERLERALAAKGFSKAPNETLLAWARRVPETARDAVERYADARYGGGDAHALTVELEEAARRVSRRG